MEIPLQNGKALGDVRRVGHIWIDRAHRVYENGTRRKAGYYPLYVRYEDSGKDEFVCLVRWQRDKIGVVLIDQRRFYKFRRETEDD